MSSARTKTPDLPSDPTGRFTRSDEVLFLCDHLIRYKGYDRSLAIEVLWNELLIPANYSPSDVDELLSRAERLKSLKFPSLGAFTHTWSPDQNRILYVTESISLNSVLANITGGEVKHRLVCRWFKPVLESLAYLHSQIPPVVHHDVWLSSIWARPATRTVKLAAPALIGPDLRKLTPLTPPDYLTANVGPWSDIWRLGLAMLTILTGKAPYCECATPADLIQKLLAHQPPDAIALVKDDMAADVIRACFHTPRTRETAIGLLEHPYFEDRLECDNGIPKSADTLPDQGRFVILQPNNAARSLPKLAPKSVVGQLSTQPESQKPASVGEVVDLTRPS
jgi:serine/threonine protein kinase